MVVVKIYEVDVVRKRNFAPKISCLRIYLLTIFHLSWPEDVYVFRFIQTIRDILLCFSQKYPNNTDIMKHIITTLVIENSVDSTSTLPETVTKSVIKSSISEGRLRKCFGYFVQMFSECTHKSYMILDRFIS